jgi:hypothetical protein
MSAESQYRKFTELVESQLVDQSHRDDRQIGGGVEWSGAFHDGRIHRDRPNRHVDEWCGRRDLSIVSVTAHLRNGSRHARSAATVFEPASEARR